MLKCLVLALLLSAALCERRKVSLYINPGCLDCDPTSRVLLYARAEGANDTLHHLWDFTHKPTVLLALTPVSATLNVSWPQFKSGDPGSISFSSPPTAAFSFVFDQLIEFNDVNNSASYDPLKFNSSTAHVHHTHALEWRLNSSKILNTTDLASVSIVGAHPSGASKGVVTISLSAFGSMDHSTAQPHLLHSINTSQVDIALSGLSTSDGFKSSRYAVGLALATTDSLGSDPKLVERKSLDDEHSPGVFTIGEVKTPTGYLSWREVAYTSPERMMTSSTVVQTGLYQLSNLKPLSRTVVTSLFGSRLDSMLTKRSYFSFGEAGGDDFYPATSYLSWTFLSSVGSPVDDSYSLFVQLMTIFGISLPCVVLLCGAVWLVFKRIHTKAHDIVFAEN